MFLKIFKYFLYSIFLLSLLLLPIYGAARLILPEYIKKENLPQEKSDQIQDMKWIDMPKSFKIFAFQQCIIEGSAYSE